MPNELTPENIMRLGLGFWGAKTLLSAIELGLFTELAKGPLDADAIRERLKLHPRSVRDFLDALVALKMLERDGEENIATPPRPISFSIAQNRVMPAGFSRWRTRVSIRFGAR